MGKPAKDAPNGLLRRLDTERFRRNSQRAQPGSWQFLPTQGTSLQNINKRKKWKNIKKGGAKKRKIKTLKRKEKKGDIIFRNC
jgi:hypothetical protein